MTDDQLTALRKLFGNLVFWDSPDIVIQHDYDIVLEFDMLLAVSRIMGTTRINVKALENFDYPYEADSEIRLTILEDEKTVQDVECLTCPICKGAK